MANDQPKRVNVGFPAWVVEGLSKQASENAIG
jgi:hypothetical protein